MGDSNAKRQNPLRRWWVLLIFLALTGVVVTRFTSMEHLGAVLSQGIWYWLVIAVAIHVIYFYVNAVLYQIGFNIVGVKSDAIGLFPVVLASVALNAVAPTGGLGGSALFILHTTKEGQSGPRTAIGIVLVMLADLITLIPFVIFGLLYLSQKSVLKFYDLLGGAIFLAFNLLMVGLIFLAFWNPSRLEGLLEVIRRLVNWSARKFKRPPFLDESWTPNTLDQFAQAADAIFSSPLPLGLLMLCGLIMHVINLVGLYAFFLAFHQPADIGAMVAGFSLGIVFFVITIIPQGIGAVEGIMGLVFTSLGMPADKALAIVLSFRGVNFWMPLVFGMFTYRRFFTQPETPIVPQEDSG